MSPKQIHACKEILAKNGYKNTKARMYVFLLFSHSSPVSMNELIEQSMGHVDRVSVYRCIELFEKLGIVRRVYIGWKYKLELSDTFVAHHHHLSCLKCGLVIDIEDEKHIDEFIHDVSRKFGFEPRQHQFEINGYCSDCSLQSKQ